MARVYFLYRSQKDKATLTVRLQDKFSDQTFYQFEAKTDIHVTKIFWEVTRLKKRSSLTGDQKNELDKYNEDTDSLDDLIIKQYVIDKPKPSDKKWLSNILKEHYTPKVEAKVYPVFLVDFIDSYLEDKKALNDLKESQRKRFTTTKNKLIKLEIATNKKYLIKDVNDIFKADYIAYSEKLKYSINTQNNEFDRIKTVCRYAQKKGIEVSNSLTDKEFKISNEKAPKIYFELEEIEKIENVVLKHDYLENAKDWLLISVYSGQRISDFMRFTKHMINTDENNRSFIIFTQVKTGHEMYLPVRTEIKNILDKRKGEFPRRISDQKYNDYIKEVCKEAGINTMCKGKKRICITPEKKKPTKNDYRDVLGDFEKWEVTTSHIGRRTFATLNYGEIPTPDLMYFTGHTTEKEFLNYIVRPDYDKAKRAYDSFNKKESKQKHIPQFTVIKNASNQ